MIFSQLRRLLPAALSAAFILSAPLQAQAQDDALAGRVDAQMAQLLGKYPIPGASIAVAYKGEFVYQRGYGVAAIETNTPATPQTLLRISSIAKPVTAVAVLKLFENELPQALERKVFGPDGLLPDSAYPEFANPRDPRVLKVTLRDLLQHTAGWGATDYDPQYDLVEIARVMNVKAPASARDVIAFMLRQRSLDVPPGTEVHYSNFGYNVLGRIIEHKSGKPYEQAVQELVFKPAGVDDAVIGGDKRVQRAANEAAYYDDPRWPQVPDQDGSGATGPESYFGFHLRTMDAHGGWVASAADLVRFVDAAQGTAKSPALLKPQTVALMKQRNGAMPDNPNGLGWVVTKMDGVNILSHSGAMTTGSYAYLQAREDGWSWAVLFNRLPIPYPPEKAMGELQAFQTAVQRGLMAAIVNKPDPMPAAK